MKTAIKKKAITSPKTHYVIIGLMMIFILVDAFIQGNKDQIFIKFFISIFTIPIFFGFVGYSHDYQLMKSLSWLAWFKRYALKPIVAYVILIIIYTFLINFTQIKNLGLTTFLFSQYPMLVRRHLYDAFFRLSFLIAIPFYSLVLYLFIRYNKTIKTYLYVVTILSVFSLIILLMPQTFRSVFGQIYVFLIEKNLMLYNMIFFGIGAFLRHHMFQNDQFSNRVMIRNATYTFFVLLITSLFYLLNQSDLFISGTQTTQSLIFTSQTVIIYLLNLAILIQLSIALKKQIIKPIPFLMRLGEVYQGIILWYGLIIIVSYRLAGSAVLTYDFSRFYVLILLFTSLFFAFIYLTRHNTWINRYILLSALDAK